MIDVELTQAQDGRDGSQESPRPPSGRARTTRAPTLADYVRDNPEPALGGERPFDEQVTIDQLASTVERADVQFAETMNQYEEAQLVTEQTQADIDQRIRVVDPPQTPLVPEPKLRTTVMKMALFTVLGALVSIALVAVVTALDHTVRREADIEAQVGLDVVATVPNAR